MAGLIQGLAPTKQQPQQLAVAVVQPVAITPVAVAVPPQVVRITTDCPHRLTRIVTIVPSEAFDFDASEKHNLTIDRTNEDWWEQFEECLWCGEWFDLVDESEQSEESKSFEW